MQKVEMPKLVLFEDDASMRSLWQRKRKLEDLSTLVIFHSWEDFLARGNEECLKDAVVFIGYRYDQVNSKYNGVDMAKMLRGRPIAKLFGISWVPSYFDEVRDLFTEILPANLPNVRKLLSLPMPEELMEVAKMTRYVYIPRLEETREWMMRG